jgi:hypothetical protein
MRIRRLLAGLFVALTLSGGGCATLAGCSDPVNGKTGTSEDSVSPSETSSPSNDNLPDNSNREPSASDTGNDVGNG